MAFEKTFYVQGVANALQALRQSQDQEFPIPSATPAQIKQINAYFKGLITLKTDQDFFDLVDKITEIFELEADDIGPNSNIYKIFLDYKDLIAEQHNNNHALYRAGSLGELLMSSESLQWSNQRIEALKKLILSKDRLEEFINESPQEARKELQHRIYNEKNFFQLKRKLVEEMPSEALVQEKKKMDEILKQSNVFLKNALKKYQSLKPMLQLSVTEMLSPWMRQNRAHIISYLNKETEKVSSQRDEIAQMYLFYDAKIQSIAIPHHRDKATIKAFQALEDNLVANNVQLNELMVHYKTHEQTLNKYLSQLSMSHRKTPVFNSVRLSIEGLEEPRKATPDETLIGSLAKGSFSLEDKPKNGEVWRFKVDCVEAAENGKPVSGRFSYDPQSQHFNARKRGNTGEYKVTEFPTTEHAKVIFSLTMAAQMLGSMSSLPSPKNPLLLRGHKEEEVRYLWTALVVLGVDADALRVVSSFKPSAEKSMLGGFARQSLYKSVFSKYPELVAEHREIAKISSDQKAFKKDIQQLKKELMKENEVTNAKEDQEAQEAAEASKRLIPGKS